jgi:hypothetical protein
VGEPGKSRVGALVALVLALALFVYGVRFVMRIVARLFA